MTDQLWAPWRTGYILKGPGKACFVCRIIKSSQDQKNYILKRTRHSFAVLNIFPYNNGHLMVIPKRHVDGLDQLKSAELMDLFQLVNQMTGRLRKVMKPHGMNIGINLGRAAGAGVPEHIHVHLVPRWNGDTNFMPVVSGTKVISESLKAVYRRLKG